MPFGVRACLYMRPVRKYTHRREALVNYFRGRIMAKAALLKGPERHFYCAQSGASGFSGGGHANLCLPSRSLIPGSIFDFAPLPGQTQRQPKQIGVVNSRDFRGGRKCFCDFSLRRICSRECARQRLTLTAFLLLALPLRPCI
jgi:hypothetical protein